MTKLGGALDRATAAYNDAVGSLEGRMLPPALRMVELGITDGKDAPATKLIETRARALTRTELLPKV